MQVSALPDLQLEESDETIWPDARSHDKTANRLPCCARYIFLTLTVQNCAGDDLEETINRMTAGFKLLVNAGKNNASAKSVKANLLGYAKAMEITYDSEKYITEKMFRDRKKYYQGRGLAIGDENPNCGKYHPHFHVLLMVKSEFSGPAIFGRTNGQKSGRTA